MYTKLLAVQLALTIAPNAGFWAFLDCHLYSGYLDLLKLIMKLFSTQPRRATGYRVITVHLFLPG